MERIVAIVNAQGVLNDVVDSNIEILTEEGFTLLDKKKVQLTPDQVAKLNIPETDASLHYTGPVVILLLAREDAFSVMNEIYPQLDDLYYTHTSFLSLRDQQFLFPQSPLLERTLCILKPGYNQEHLSLLVDAFTEHGFVILGKVARVLPLDIAQVVTSSSDAAKAIASEVSVLFALEKLNAVTDLKLLLGPNDPDEARLHAPYTIRARLGKTIDENAAYASLSIQDAQRDLGLCFPNPFPIERTVLVLSPAAVAHQALVSRRLEDAGFTTIATDTLNFSSSRVESLFKTISPSSSTTSVVDELTAGPSYAYLLARPAAVTALRILIGPADPSTAQRLAPMSLSLMLHDMGVHNSLLASTDPSDALRMAKALFPNVASDAPLTSADVDALLRHGPDGRASMQATLSQGLAELCRVKPQGKDAIRWLAHWLLRHNPQKPDTDEPIIETPADTDAAVAIHTPHSTAASIASTGPKRIVFAISGPGSCPSGLWPLLASGWGAQHVDVPQLISAAMNQQTDLAELLRKHHRLCRPVPSHIMVRLIKDAIAATNAHTVLLTQAPLCLDDARALQEAKLNPTAVVVLACSVDAAVSRMMSSQTVPALRQELEDQLQGFAEKSAPVLELYAASGQLTSVQTEDVNATVGMVANDVRKSLQSVMTVNQAEDPLPMKLRGPPKKKAVVEPMEDY